jgi:hypothetical protein
MNKKKQATGEEKVPEYRNKAENIKSEIILIERSERERVI